MTEDYFLENLNICNVTYNTSKSMLIYLDLTVVLQLGTNLYINITLT